MVVNSAIGYSAIEDASKPRNANWRRPKRPLKSSIKYGQNRMTI